jgi:hypothetical protein
MHSTTWVRGEKISGAGQDPNLALWRSKAHPLRFLEPAEIVSGLCARSMTTEVFGFKVIFPFRVFQYTNFF